MTLRAIVGLGSSLARGIDVLAAAVVEIGRIPRVSLVSTSEIVRTAAFGGRALSPFFNAACVVETSLAPPALLASLHAVERRFGRLRVAKDAPRTLDLDVLLVEHHLSRSSSSLSRAAPRLPHPGLSVRASALFPAREAWGRATHTRAPVDLSARVSRRGIVGPVDDGATTA